MEEQKIIPALGHEWGTPTYEWSADNSQVTATRICAHDAEHVETETVSVAIENTDTTCTEQGQTVYTAVFENESFEKQTKVVMGAMPLGHKLTKHETDNNSGIAEVYWSCGVCDKCFGEAEAETEIHVIAAKANPAKGGVVLGSGNYEENENVTLTAANEDGYRFVNWTEGSTVVSTNSTLTFAAKENRNLTANFMRVYTISTVANPAGGGTITGAGTYDENAKVTLTARANTGYRFVHWKEGSKVIGTSASISFNARENRNLSAVFVSTSGYAYGIWGTCVWSIDNNGVLTLGGGTGEELDPDEDDQWYMFTDEVTRIVAREKIILPEDCSNMLADFENLTSADLSGFDTSNVTYMLSMFEGCSSLTSVDVSGFDTSNVTDMSCMFYDCGELTGIDVSGFETGNVTDMSSMFEGCSSLTSVDVSGFDTSNVTDMSSMFSGCSGLESLDVSGFDTSSVMDLSAMFYDCSELAEIDVSDFDTSSVTDMSSMFIRCSSLESLDVSGFDTSEATKLNSMFDGCSNLKTIDVSGFDTSNVTDLSGMFSGCSGLTDLDVSSFDTSNVTNIGFMFYGCTNLQRLDLSGFDTKRANQTAYMFGGCNALGFISVGQKATFLSELPEVRINGHTDWFSIGTGQWFTVCRLAGERSGVADMYIKKQMKTFDKPDFILPSSLKEIQDNAFAGAPMTIAEISNGCRRIGNYAFKQCTNLMQIRIPASCTDIGEDVFSGCDQTFVFGKKGSAAEIYCSTHENCVFVDENEALKPTPVPTPTPTPKPTPTPTPKPTPTPTPKKITDLVEIYGYTISKANTHLYTYDKLIHAGDGYYSNDYFGVQLDSNSRINWIGLFSDSVIYKIYGVQIGFSRTQAENELKRWGFSAGEATTSSGKVTVMYSYRNEHVMVVYQSNKVTSVAYSED